MLVILKELLLTRSYFYIEQNNSHSKIQGCTGILRDKTMDDKFVMLEFLLKKSSYILCNSNHNDFGMVQRYLVFVVSYLKKFQINGISFVSFSHFYVNKRNCAQWKCNNCGVLQKKYLSFGLSHIPDIFIFLLFYKIFEFNINLSLEYQVFCNLQYVILLPIAL